MEFKKGDRVISEAEKFTGTITYVHDFSTVTVKRDDGEPGGGHNNDWITNMTDLKHLAVLNWKKRIEIGK